MAYGPSRRDFLALVGKTVLSVAPLSLLPAAAAAGKRPNIVVVLCDDLGYGDLGCYGNEMIETPRLDQFSADGARLTDCYASAPVCSPSRAGMLTGRTPHRCGVYDWIRTGDEIHLHRDEVTVATLLQRAGYATCHVGKWHLTGRFTEAIQPQPGDHGFDHWFSTANNAQASHRNPINFVRNGESVGRLEGYSSTIIVDEAIGWLEQRDSDKPFALFVWFHSPHEPVATASSFTERYTDVVSPKQAEYFGNVTQMDHAFGRLLDALDAEEARADTFVHFTSDNGPETLNRYRGASHSYGTAGSLRGMKLHLYEGGIRVPGIVQWPGKIESGSLCREPVNNTDLLPTLCAMAGVAAPRDRIIDGVNLLPLLDGGRVARPRPLYWRYDEALGGMTSAMREGDWKLLADKELNRFELYNLRDDPGETTDLAAEEPTRLEAMKKVFLTVHQEIEKEGRRWY